MSPEVLKFKGAKAFLRCSDSTLLAAANDGTIPAFKVGKMWRFYLRDLQALRWTPPERAESTPSPVRPVRGKRKASVSQ